MTQTTPVAEIRALVEQGKRLLKGEREIDPDQDTDDPELQLLLKYKVAPGSRLRTLHKAKVDAAADGKRLAAKIDAAQSELWRLDATHLARWDTPSIDTELPTTDEALHYEGAKGRAELIRHCMDAWKGQIEGYQLKAGDAGVAWDDAYASWKNLIFSLYGDEACAPPWRTRDWERPSGPEKWQLEQTRAQLEA